MKKSTGIILGIIGTFFLLVIIIVGWGVSTYNGIVSAETTVDEKSSAVRADLQRRSDLIPNLVETVKGYAKHEEQIFTELADARAKLSGAQTVAEQEAANTEISSALSRLLVIVENYPDLKANQNFINLQTQLEGTENRIKVSRLDYNKAVKDYNIRLRRFPSSIIAGMFGFEKADMFEGEEGIESVPNISF
ncbi:MAG TPA: LemA family protein [Ruminococcaceae bacterium]|jgi:LemA protein|nr:LemA family protein [Oscillospiraceae bacterium]HCA31124.1 LemA family protein [Oscillospiraceae bacterium]